MRILCVQIDGGKLPNLALMRIMATHRARGDEVVFSRQTGRGLFDGEFDRVYGSLIFTTSAAKVARLRASWPHAIVGGSGVADRPDASAADKLQVEGAAQEAEGAAQKTVGDVKSATKDAANKAADFVNKKF